MAITCIIHCFYCIFAVQTKKNNIVMIKAHIFLSVSTSLDYDEIVKNFEDISSLNKFLAVVLRNPRYDGVEYRLIR